MSESQPVRTPNWLTLAPTERLQFRAHPSSNVLLAVVVAGFLVLVVGSIGFAAVGAVDVGRRVTLAMLASITLLAGGCFLGIRRREYVLTTDRAYVAVGLRSKTVTAIDIADVDEVVLARGRWRRWVNAGDLRFVANGEAVLTFRLVENPRAARERARTLV